MNRPNNFSNDISKKIILTEENGGRLNNNLNNNNNYMGKRKIVKEVNYTNKNSRVNSIKEMEKVNKKVNRNNISSNNNNVVVNNNNNNNKNFKKYTEKGFKDKNYYGYDERHNLEGTINNHSYYVSVYSRKNTINL